MKVKARHWVSYYGFHPAGEVFEISAIDFDGMTEHVEAVEEHIFDGGEKPDEGSERPVRRRRKSGE